MRAHPKILVLLVLTAFAFSAQAREVTACGHHDYPPWNWKQGDQIVGACAEVTRRAFAALGHTVNLKYVGPWKRCQSMVERGEVDINICAFRNPEREAYSRFSEVPMGFNPIAVFVKRGHEFPFKQWSDLAGRRTGLVDGVSMGPEFDQFLLGQTDVKKTTTSLASWKMLELQRIDFVAIGLVAGQLELARYGLSSQIVPLPHPVMTGKLHISVSSKSTDLVAQLPELDRYLSRKAYRQELDRILEESHSLYLKRPTVPVEAN